MDKEIKQPEIKRERGRPSLPPDVKKERRLESKRNYNKSHPDILVKANQNFREKYDRFDVAILKEYRPIIDKIALETGLDIQQLFLSAFESQYNVKLTK